MGAALLETKAAAEAAKESADASSRSADVAHDTFVSTHRPKLTIRFMSIDDPTRMLDSISGTFLVFNTGESRAVISRYWTEVSLLKVLPAVPPYWGKHGERASDVILLAGQSCPMKFPTVGPKPVSGMTEFKSVFAGIQGEGGSLYVMGWIEYADDAARTRTMGFCREYDFQNRRFKHTAEEDYEYED
jgi:hypothetical protein